MEHRFVLEKYHRERRYTCPACHRPHCYTRYVDSQGEIELPMEFGRCDHEGSCGYHRPPSKDDVKEALKGLPLHTPLKVPPTVAKPKAKPSFIPDNLVQATMWSFQENPLYRFLSKVFGEADTARLMVCYGVGTSKMWGGAAVFWQRDINQRVRTGKVMGYDPETGHRIKQPHPLMNWAHVLLRDKIQGKRTSDGHSDEYLLEQCYFGEHLLSKVPLDFPIYIVESEKTALIARGFCPNALWIATGGISNLRPSRALKGRPLILFPDLGAEAKWEQKAQEMMASEHKPASVTVSNLLTLHATKEQRQSGWDLADFLLAGLINRPHLLYLPDHPDYDPFPSKEKPLESTVNQNQLTPVRDKYYSPGGI